MAREHRARVPVRFPEAPVGTCKHCGRSCAPHRRTHDECREQQADANDYRQAAARREGSKQRCVDCRRVEGETYQIPGDFPGGWKWYRVKIQRDHPQELVDNGPRDWTVPRCSRCHAEKTARERARREGRSMDGWTTKDWLRVPVAATLIGAAVWFWRDPVEADDPYAVIDASVDRLLVVLGVMAAAVVVTLLLRHAHGRRVEAVQRIGDAVAKETNTDPTKVALRVRRWRRGPAPVSASCRYSPFFDDAPGSPARERVEEMLRRKISPDLTFRWSPARDRLRWSVGAAATEPADEPDAAPAEPSYADRLRGTHERVEGSVAATIKGDVEVEWGDADAVGPLSFVVRYPSSFNDDAPDVRQMLTDKINHKAPGRWSATWDTEQNSVRFDRRPAMASMIPNPVVTDETDERQWRLPFGVNESGDVVQWSLRTAPHCLIVGPSGSGKTVTLRSIITDAAARGFTVFCVDPKRVELTGLRDWPGVRAVASTTEEMIALVGMLADEMDARYAAIEAGETTEDDLAPVLVVLDEMTEWIARVNEWWKANRRGGTGTEHPVVARFRSMARLGRTGRVHMVVGIQRPDAKVFGGEARDNFGFRVALGKMSADGARMVFGRTDVARDDALAELKGRATVGLGEHQATEVQTYFTPNPRTPKDARERGHLAALRAHAEEQQSAAVEHINPRTIAAFAAALTDPDAPMPTTRRKSAKTKPEPQRASVWEQGVRLDDLNEGDVLRLDLDGNDTVVTVNAKPCPTDDDESEYEIDYSWGDGHTGTTLVDVDDKFERMRVSVDTPR